jgi:hypothetical protein
MKKKLRTSGLWLGASFCLLMLALTATFAAPAARADPPEVFPLTAFDFVDTTCGFDVSVHFVLNGEVLRVFSNGNALVTGPLSAKLSANGKTVSANISGPGIFRTNPDGSLTVFGAGTGLWRVQTATGLTLAVVAGQISVDFETGVATLDHATVLIDLCAALAP